jgi:hypothetical protein
LPASQLPAVTSPIAPSMCESDGVEVEESTAASALVACESEPPSPFTSTSLASV